MSPEVGFDRGKRLPLRLCGKLHTLKDSTVKCCVSSRLTAKNSKDRTHRQQVKLSSSVSLRIYIRIYMVSACSGLSCPQSATITADSPLLSLALVGSSLGLRPGFVCGEDVGVPFGCHAFCLGEWLSLGCFLNHAPAILVKDLLVVCETRWA